MRSEIRSIVRWAGVATVTGGVIACRQIVGVSTLRGPTCGLVFDDSCAACVEGACCTEATACAASPGCALLESCTAGCHGDPACRAQCAVDHRVGDDAQPAAAALDACLATSCEDPCGLSCGALSKVAPPGAAAACADCIRATACSTARACAQSADCQRTFLCRENCITGDCIGACMVPNDDGGASYCASTCAATQCVTDCTAGADSGSTLYSSFYGSIAGGQCQQACDAANNWSCVGVVPFPAAKGRPRVLTLALGGFQGGAPVSGALVTMCNGGDPTCAMSIDHAMTDDAGLVQLVDDTGSPNGGPYGLNGLLSVSSPALVPTLIYWGFPLSELHGLFGTPLPVFSPTDLQGLALLGVTVDPTRGHVALIATDCLGNQASGVTFSATGIDASTVLRYAAGNSLSATGPTDYHGAAFFFNVPAGPVDIQATPASLGSVSGRQSVVVQAGWITEVSIAPSPAP